MAANDPLDEQLRSHNQQHLLAFEDRLDNARRAQFREQIAAIDFGQLAELHRQAQTPAAAINPGAIRPFSVVPLPRNEQHHQERAAASRIGEQAIRAGRVAALMVAGGQATRLGIDKPKGMFPIGPVNQTTLFQVFAEQLLAWRRRAGRPIPWYIMTSAATHAPTVEYFQSNDYFGMAPDDVKFFSQGNMPAVELHTGKVLLADETSIFTSPNGHGGVLLALREHGLLDDMARRGVEHISYFQVDNPFVKVLDPEFIGFHLQQEAEFSAKVVRKRHAHEKVGVIVEYEGKPAVIEYSDLPAELAQKTNESGELEIWAGSIAVHVVCRRFLERITTGRIQLPYHAARKAVPHVDETGQRHEPTKPNAIKFEMFIFDAMPLAQRVVVLETSRDAEFWPVKNASGDDSPDVVQQALIDRAARWLRNAGVAFPTHDDGRAAVPLEISPLAGLDEDEFRRKLKRQHPIDSPTYLRGEE